MDTTKPQQIALDDALVTPVNRLKIEKCNHRLSSDLKSNEPTIQVTPGQKFIDPSFEEEILSFIRDLGYTGEIKGMYHKKNVDYVYILWEDLVYQVENKNSKKNNDICYPRFTKVIIDYFMSKAYKEYYVVAAGAEPPKAKTKYKKKADEPVTSPKKKPVQATKGNRLKLKGKVTKPDKEKQPAKKTKAKGLVVLSEVALSEVEQIKLDTKRSNKDFRISHESGSEEVDAESRDVRWWKNIRERSQAYGKDNMTSSYSVSTNFRSISRIY
uniref:Uncharacterized protein n=1 Tax=Tanacetum cinerariifolium TaxID=118510 RepID=A0A6L2LRU5_TANCI|nr:hypothetical protein [Tanacetum cinerariifolium]